MHYTIEMSNYQNNKAFSMIADIEGDFKDLIDVETPDELPILPVRNMVIFPGVVSPILIGRESSLALIKRAEKKNLIIGIVTQKDAEIEDPTFEDLYEYGVFAKVVKQLSLPGGNITVILQGFGRMRLKDISGTRPFLTGSGTETRQARQGVDYGYGRFAQDGA